MPFDTSIPLRDISAPIMSPMQQETLRSHVQQRQWDEADRQKKAQQDQAVQKILSDPENMDPETGTPSTKGIISVGRLLGPEWAAKASHTYAQTLSSLSEQKKRLHDITLSNKKQQVMWTKQLSEDSLGNLVAEMQTNPNQADAFVKVNGRMIDRINELYRNGKAREMGLNEDDREEMLRGLPKNAAELKAAGTKLGDLEKQLEAMMSDQPEAAAPKAEGPTVAPTKPQEDVEAVPLDDVGKGLKQGREAIPIVKDMQGKVEEALDDDGTPQQTVSLKDVAKAPPIEVTGKQPEVNSTSLRNLAKTEETRADAEQKAGRINNAKKLRDQSKAHMTQAKELVREAQRDDETELRRQHEERVAANKEKEGGRDRTSSLSPDAEDTAAFQYTLNGTLPPNLARSFKGQTGPEARNIINKSAKLQKEMGLTPQDVAVLRANNKALAPALAQLSKQKEAVEGFERTLQTNVARAKELSEQIRRTNSPWLNEKLSTLREQGIVGDPKIQELIQRLYDRNEAIAAEVGKIMSGAMGNTALAVSAQEHARKLANGDMSINVLAASLDEIAAEAKTGRVQGLRTQVKQILSEMTNVKKSPDDARIDDKITEPVKPASGVTPFSDVEKEKRYQEWRKKNGY